jgi:hypothetical protein
VKLANFPAPDAHTGRVPDFGAPVDLAHALMFSALSINRDYFSGSATVLKFQTKSVALPHLSATLISALTLPVSGMLGR